MKTRLNNTQAMTGKVVERVEHCERSSCAQYDICLHFNDGTCIVLTVSKDRDSDLGLGIESAPKLGDEEKYKLGIISQSEHKFILAESAREDEERRKEVSRCHDCEERKTYERLKEKYEKNTHANPVWRNFSLLSTLEMEAIKDET